MRPSSGAWARSSATRDLFQFRGTAPDAMFAYLPALTGDPIEVSYLPNLTAWRGQLLSGDLTKGTSVRAGSFLRKRTIVLDQSLVRTPHLLGRIFIHEVFHFVWLRLGTPLRESYAGLIGAELERGATGELGWSAESRKDRLDPKDPDTRTRRWREYLSESFCDTGGWLYGGAARYAERTLAREFRERRRSWMRDHVESRTLGI